MCGKEGCGVRGHGRMGMGMVQLTTCLARLRSHRIPLLIVISPPPRTGGPVGPRGPGSGEACRGATAAAGRPAAVGAAVGSAAAASASADDDDDDASGGVYAGTGASLLTHVTGLLTHVTGLLTYVPGLLTHVAGLLAHVSSLLTHIAGLLAHVTGLLTHVTGLRAHSVPRRPSASASARELQFCGAPAGSWP